MAYMKQPTSAKFARIPEDLNAAFKARVQKLKDDLAMPIQEQAVIAGLIQDFMALTDEEAMDLVEGWRRALVEEKRKRLKAAAGNTGLIERAKAPGPTRKRAVTETDPRKKGAG